MTEEEKFYRREIEPHESRSFVEWWKAEAKKFPAHLSFEELYRLRTIAFLAYERGFREGVNL